MIEPSPRRRLRVLALVRFASAAWATSASSPCRSRMAVPQPHRERLLPFAELGQGEAGELIDQCLGGLLQGERRRRAAQFRGGLRFLQLRLEFGDALVHCEISTRLMSAEGQKRL